MDAPLAVAVVYLVALVGGFVIVAVWETLAPARPARTSLRARWSANIGLLAVNHGVLPFLMPLTNAGAAWFAAEQGWGLLHNFALPPLAAFAITIVALDAARYAIHRLMHAAPPLWRLHRVHHSDLDYDFTVGLRFHPIEAVVVSLALMAIVIALGAPLWAVVASDSITIALGYFSHGNIRVVPAIDRALRFVFVTPAMHATHHSVERDEAMSNFGGVFSVWDRWFGSYRDRPAAGDDIAFGLAEERDPERLGILRLLRLPFTAR